MANIENIQTTLESAGQGVWSIFLKERNITANEAAALLCDEYLELEKSGALDLFLRVAENDGHVAFIFGMDELAGECNGKTFLTPLGCALYRFIKQQHPHVCHYARILSVERDASADMPKHISAEILQKIEQRYRAQNDEIRKLVCDLMDCANLEKIDPFELTDKELKAVRTRVREVKMDRDEQEKTEEKERQAITQVQNGGLFIAADASAAEEEKKTIKPKTIFDGLTTSEKACLEEMSLKKGFSRADATEVLESVYRKGLVAKEVDIRYSPVRTIYKITNMGRIVTEYMLMQDDISEFLEGESGFVLMDDLKEKAWRIRTRNMIAKELVAKRWTIEIDAEGVDVIAEKDGKRHGFVVSPKLPTQAQVRLIANRIKHFTFIVKNQGDVDASIIRIQDTARRKSAEATVITKLQASSDPFAQGLFHGLTMGDYNADGSKPDADRTEDGKEKTTGEASGEAEGEEASGNEMSS